jgi:hypothetical protein
VDGSAHKRCSLNGCVNVLATTSIKSSLVNASPEIGSVPFCSTYRSIRAFSYTVPDVLETTGAVGGEPETVC